MIKELERVVMLVADLPEEYQKEAAERLAWFVKLREEEMTMTPEEIEALRRVQREKTHEMIREIREILNLPR